MKKQEGADDQTPPIPPTIEAETISLRGVVLKGWDASKVGAHSAFVRNGLIVNFRNGQAEVPETVETELREAGVIE